MAAGEGPRDGAYRTGAETALLAAEAADEGFGEE
jgi:hypothetical protein